MSNMSTALSRCEPSSNGAVEAPPAEASPIRWGYPIRALMDPEAEMLSVSQQWVLEELAEGSSITVAAEEAGVCRQTIYNWLRHDARFAAAVARWRRAHHETVADQLMASADAAARCVSHAIRTRDARTALALLKGLGFLNGRAAEKARGADPKSEE